MRILLAAAAIAALAVPAAAQDHSAHGPSQHAMMTALAMDNRAEDRARDEHRHPAETLAFFRVEPGMTVVDYMPASGWYTRVLVPYLGPEGQYIGLTPDPAAADGEGFRNYFAKLPQDYAEDAPGWNLEGAPHMVAVSNAEALEPWKGKVDRVLIFREMHNLLRSGSMYTELTRIRELLADDGLLGIVQHRANADAPADYTLGTKGYLRQDDVIALVEAHGFELVDTSEINANPRDTADHPEGVWEMPPVLRTKREDLKALGESDRMTLLFRKR